MSRTCGDSRIVFVGQGFLTVKVVFWSRFFDKKAFLKKWNYRLFVTGYSVLEDEGDFVFRRLSGVSFYGILLFACFGLLWSSH